VVDPSDLRKALAALQGRSYAEGDMHDAGGWRLACVTCSRCCDAALVLIVCHSLLLSEAGWESLCLHIHCACTYTATPCT
jgi:hypothetical protein